MSASALHSYNRLPDQLGALDLSLRVAATKVPGPVRTKLANAAEAVELGRASLAHEPDPGKYLFDVGTHVIDGVNALSDASRLVGTQCGFTLPTYSMFSF